MTFPCPDCDHLIVLPPDLSERDVLKCPHCNVRFEQADEIESTWQAVNWREDRPALH
jgi:uncharacterized paraquat-inducible protein A